MTEIYVQKLQVTDCETALLRAYFDWGRGWPDDSPDPDWDTASADQRAQIAHRGYGFYDGLPPQHGNEIGLAEIYSSIGINSRIVVYDAVRFLRRADEVRTLLSRIPDAMRLEVGSEEQIGVAGSLLDLLGHEVQIGRGKATKVLHKKRPAFIPIIDSVVGDFLWKNFPHLLTQESSSADVLAVFQLVLLRWSEHLRQVQSNLEERHLSLSTTRILDFLIWIVWRDHIDESGFGRSFQVEWGTRSMRKVRKMAHDLWEGQEIPGL